MKKLTKQYLGEFFLILSALSFSFEWFFIRKLSFEGFGPIDIVFIRALFAAIILAVILPLLNRNFFNFKKINRHEFKYIFILSCVVITSGLFFNWAIKTTSVANTLIILYLSVFWGMILGFLFLGEKSTGKKIIYTFLAFFGVCLALIKKENQIALSIGMGEIFALLASFLFSFEAIISRKIRKTKTTQRLFLSYVVIAGITFILIGLFSGLDSFEHFFTWNVLIYGGALAITCGIMGKGFMYLGINIVPVSLAMTIMLVEPIIQMITAYFFADERLILLNIVGIILVFFMITKISAKKKELVVVE